MNILALGTTNGKPKMKRYPAIIPVLVLAGLAFSTPVFANCIYKGQEYSEGSVVDMGGILKRCRYDGIWVKA